MWYSLISTHRLPEFLKLLELFEDFTDVWLHTRQNAVEVDDDFRDVFVLSNLFV